MVDFVARHPISPLPSPFDEHGPQALLSAMPRDTHVAAVDGIPLCSSRAVTSPPLCSPLACSLCVTSCCCREGEYMPSS